MSGISSLAQVLRVSAGLSEGDVLPNWTLRTLGGKPFNFYTDSVIGRCQVIVVCPKGGEAEPLLQWYKSSASAFASSGAWIHIVCAGDMDSPSTDSLQSLLSDPDGQILHSLGEPLSSPMTLVLRHNNHIAGLFDGESQGMRALQLANKLSTAHPRFEMQQHHPPVLLIPDVFSLDECKALIEIFKSRGQSFVEGNQARDVLGGQDYKMRIPEHMREDRVDHFFFEKDTLKFLEARLGRVLPEIFKAFQYRVSRYESLRMACYKGARSGLGHGHRDNVPPHLHRRFAMSINLNTDEFEGGELRFPEFSDVRYRPASGTGIVFSSSLVHEALQVTAGTRFVFLVFLFGEH